MTVKDLYPTVLPSLNLDFANSEKLDPRVTFTRASVGTYVNKSGLIKTAASGVARFDHNPATGESLGLLMEEARTNSFSNSTFALGNQAEDGNVVITPNAFMAPDGTMTATRIRADYINYINSPFPYMSVAGQYTIYSYWIYVNTIPRIRTRLEFTDYGGATQIDHTVQAGVWTRIFHKTPVAADITGRNIQPSMFRDAGGNVDVYVWGFQLENGSFPTSYIPTTSSTVTRAADVATLSNANSSIFPTSAFTLVNSPYGTASGSSTLKLVGPTIKRTAVYNGDLTQTQINTLAGVNDNFWRWRVLGSSFALPTFTTDGSVTVDWGDGVVETLTTGVHTFTNGSGYHDIGFRLNSGTFFQPYINNNSTYGPRVIAVGPAPASMKLKADRAFYGCNTSLKSFDATVDVSVTPNFYQAWGACSGLTSFPLINTAAGTGFREAWAGCSSLTSFPLINTAAGTDFSSAWNSCTSLTSFPLINTAAGTSFFGTWYGCLNLTSFPLINTAAGTDFSYAWYGCSSLTTFPLITTAAGTNFSQAWRYCSSLTSFPLINTAAGTDFTAAWYGCSSLTSFPLINTAAAISFYQAWGACSGLTSFPLISTGTVIGFNTAWAGCSSLTSFPLINTASGTDFGTAWAGCSSLTSFPLINTAAGTNFSVAWQSCSSLTSFPLINTAAGIGFDYAWQGCTSLTSFPLINTAAGTNFQSAWQSCSSLTSFPSLNFAAGTNFQSAWQYCSSLTSFPANIFNTTGTLYSLYNAFYGCALTATSIENILTSLVTNGRSNNYLGLDGGTNANASTWSVAAQNAYEILVNTGWTITQNGTFSLGTFVSLLLHGDGTNGSTTITDNSLTPKTITANAGARISTTQSKFGGSSIEFLSNANTSLTVAPSTAFQFGTGSFTVEAWIYQRTIAQYSTILEVGNHLGASAFVIISGSSGLYFYCGGFYGSSTILTTNQWNHVAISYDGSTVKSFTNGILNFSVAFSGNLTDYSTVSVGYPLGYIPSASTNAYRFNGYIDELRVTKGVARYTSNFTPPTLQFTNP